MEMFYRRSVSQLKSRGCEITQGISPIAFVSVDTDFVSVL